MTVLWIAIMSSCSARLTSAASSRPTTATRSGLTCRLQSPPIHRPIHRFRRVIQCPSSVAGTINTA
jgi:hypothetical protein